MKKFILVLFVLIFVLTCFSGCEKMFSSETEEIPTLPENAIVVTANPIEETAEADQIISEIINK